MKLFKCVLFPLSVILIVAGSLQKIHAQGTAFTYQGRLNSAGNVASGSYDFAFALYNDPSAGTQQGSAVTNSAVVVSNGLFTTAIDFGASPFNGQSVWLQIFVRTNGAGAFTAILPRQALTPAPYAITAQSVTGLVPGAQISGPISNSALPSGVITNGATGVNISGSFTGNGSGITNVSLNSVAVTRFTGQVVGWGYNATGQINVPASVTNVIAVAAAAYSSAAVNADGTVTTWGENSRGEGSVPAGLTNAIAIAGGSYHFLALKSDGTVVGWGENGWGQTSIPSGLSNVISVAAGAYHSLALKSDGTVVAWGFNADGETDVPAGLTNVIAISASAADCLALKSDGTVVAWGNNDIGQINVPAGLTNIVGIGGGSTFSAALKSDGTLVEWGGGQQNVAGVSNVSAIVCSVYNTAAIKSDGTVVVLGDNSWGQTNPPAGLNNVAALSQGSSALHFLAVQKEPLTAVALLNADNKFAGNVEIGGNLKIDGLLTSALRLSDSNLWLRGGADVNHGLGWYGTGKTFAGVAPDGPVLFGYGGGILGTTAAGEIPMLIWNSASVTVNGDLNATYGLNVAGSLVSSGPIIGSAASLTNMNASQLAAGTVPPGRLAGSYTNALTFTSASLAANGIFRLNDRPIYLRTGGDVNHGLAYNGQTVTNFGTGNVQVDGPVLWGFSGGALGVMSGGQKAILTWTNGGASVNGGFSFSSDRNVKDGFETLDPADVLGKLSTLPVSSWSYTNDVSSRHIGPMAQDFHQAFGLNGPDETHINIGDEAGVALAALKGVNENEKTLAKELREQSSELRAKDAQIRELMRRIERLESKLSDKH